MYRRRRTFKWFSPTGKRILLGLFLLGIALFFIGMVLVLRLWQGNVPAEALHDSAEVAAEAGAPPSQAPRVPLAVAEREVLENYFNAMGGTALLESISSLRAEGNLVFPNGQDFPVVVVKKSGRIRVSMRAGANTLVQGFKPGDAWRAVFSGGHLVSVEDMTREDIHSMSLYAHVASELYLARRENWRVNYLGVRDFNYRMLHVFEVEVSARHHARFFIDPETFIEVGREDHVFEEDGTLTIIRILNSGILEASGLRMPERLETYIDGELTQTLVLTRIEVNPGVLDSSFDRPHLDDAI